MHGAISSLVPWVWGLLRPFRLITDFFNYCFPSSIHQSIHPPTHRSQFARSKFRQPSRDERSGVFARLTSQTFSFMPSRFSADPQLASASLIPYMRPNSLIFCLADVMCSAAEMTDLSFVHYFLSNRASAEPSTTALYSVFVHSTLI